jgi:hypothetical protein
MKRRNIGYDRRRRRDGYEENKEEGRIGGEERGG